MHSVSARPFTVYAMSDDRNPSGADIADQHRAELDAKSAMGDVAAKRQLRLDRIEEAMAGIYARGVDHNGRIGPREES